MTLTLRSTQHLELGDPETCFSLLDSAEKVAHETGCEFYLAEIERHRGRARWACGYGDAAGVLARALMTSQRQGAVVFELRALTDLERAGALGPAEAGRLADLRADPGCVTAAGPILPASVGA